MYTAMLNMLTFLTEAAVVRKYFNVQCFIDMVEGMFVGILYWKRSRSERSMCCRKR